jgi:hypothetical protein
MDSFHTCIDPTPPSNRHPTAQLPGGGAVKCDPIVLGRAGPVLGRAMPCWAPNCHLNRSYPLPIAHLCLGICWAHARAVLCPPPPPPRAPPPPPPPSGAAATAAPSLAAPPERISCDAARPAGPVRRAGRRHGGRAGGLGGQPAGFAGVSPPHAPRTRPEAVATPVRDFLARGPKSNRHPTAQLPGVGVVKCDPIVLGRAGPVLLLRRSRGCPRARGGTGGGPVRPETDFRERPRRAPGTGQGPNREVYRPYVEKLGPPVGASWRQLAQLVQLGQLFLYDWDAV